MVNNEASSLDAVFGALADQTRRAMLARLAAGPASVGELGAPFNMTKGAVSKHIKVLERSGLLERDIQGRVHRCQLEPAALQQAARWVEQVRAHWEARFDTLADYLEELQSSEIELHSTATDASHQDSCGQDSCGQDSTEQDLSQRDSGHKGKKKHD